MSTSPNGKLKFRGTDIPGLITRFVPSAVSNHPYRTKFCGVDGISEIKGGTGARQVVVQMVLYGNFRTRDALRDYVEHTLEDGLVGVNGTLIYSGTTPRWYRKFDDCTYEGFGPEQDDLLDEAGLLDGYWFTVGTLHFVQLKP